MTNLIDNAVNALNVSGEISINTDLGDFFLVIEIMENGPGVPDVIQINILDPNLNTGGVFTRGSIET